jgi:hypothetical protein
LDDSRSAKASGHSSKRFPWFSNGRGQRFLVSRAGDSLSPGLLDRGCRLLAETGHLEETMDGVRVLCTAAARGLFLADADSWSQVLDRIATRSPASVEVNTALQRPPPVTAD